jgi:hypothetical protein
MVAPAGRVTTMVPLPDENVKDPEGKVAVLTDPK